MQRSLNFYKEANNWYVQLDDWPGSKEDLQMVAGADNMLDIISEGESSVTINVNTAPIEGSDVLEFINKAGLSDDDGAYYMMRTYKQVEYNLDMWLCKVTHFVFGEYPKSIYVS